MARDYEMIRYIRQDIVIISLMKVFQDKKVRACRFRLSEMT